MNYNLKKNEQSQFNIVSSWKINWLKNITKDGGAQAKCIDLKNRTYDKHIVVKSKTVKYGNMWALIDPGQLMTLTEKDHGIYEVLSHFPQGIFRY